VVHTALLSSCGASRRRRHRQRERGRHAFASALTFAITFYSAVDTGSLFGLVWFTLLNEFDF